MRLSEDRPRRVGVTIPVPPVPWIVKGRRLAEERSHFDNRPALRFFAGSEVELWRLAFGTLVPFA